MSDPPVSFDLFIADVARAQRVYAVARWAGVPCILELHDHCGLLRFENRADCRAVYRACGPWGHERPLFTVTPL